MLFYRPSDRVQILNDPDGFYMPYEMYSDTDKEVLEWKYYRLHNKGKTLLSVRCLGLIYGGSQRH